MGRTYFFSCGKCRYTAKVAGGPAEGLEFTVQTILCRECKELQDAVTAARVASGDEFGTISGQFDSPPPLEKLFNRLPSLRRLNGHLKAFDLTCVSSPLHRVRAWNQPDKCPRCGNFMESSGFPFSLWD